MSNLTFEQYTEAAKKTAVFPQEIRESYLSLGLIGEVGEVADVWKKHLRKGGSDWLPVWHELNRETQDAEINPHSIFSVRRNLALELGDVWWYTALRSEDEEECDRELPVVGLTSHETDLSSRLIDLSFNVNYYIRGDISFRAYVHDLIQISNIVYTVEGIWQMNIDKLAARAAKNELKDRK